ncbi:unnamed protein product [Adineta ricciae]|uniref:ABC transmembrane type-1 domain-containing protein n=1 Tax=Adineta ricciae TaxID=249248 RepID=A0A814BZA7_ADIRI|nr:unnamed protein product [Adineta ricciae]CAF1601875.1 unnamed protein product [Adineta ricciae]
MSSDEERELLISNKTKCYDASEHHPRQASRLEWAESSWTRWFHLLLWWWVSPVLSFGYKRALTDDDFDNLPHDDECSVLLNKMLMYDWMKTTTLPVIAQAFWKQFVYVGLLLIPLMIARIAQPILLHHIVSFIDNDQQNSSITSPIAGYFYAITLFLCALSQILLYQQYFFRSARIGLRIRNALISLIHTRLLSINITSLNETTAAPIINLVANDATKFEDFSMYFSYLWDTPLQAIIVYGILCWLIGPLLALFGYLVLAVFIILQGIFSRQFSRFRETTIVWADKRIQAFEEIINGYHIVKMYNWEEPIKRRVLEIRQHEFTSIQYASYLRAFNVALFFAIMPIMALVTCGGAFLIKKPLHRNIHQVRSLQCL